MSFSDPRIAYAAHTATCTFLLDEEGICVDIVAAPGSRKDPRTGSTAQCLGAQYVASLDLASSGGLVELPSTGSTMLFARVDERGRVSLVRTGAVTEFESRRDADPFDGPPTADSGAVWTSAPELPPREEAPSPRVKRSPRQTHSTQPARASEGEHAHRGERRVGRRVEPTEERPDLDFGLDYDDDDARTRVIQALRPEEVLPLTRRRDEQPMPLVTRRAIRRSQPSAGESQPLRREATREALRDPGREVSAARQAQPRGMLPKRAPQFVPNEAPPPPPPPAQVQAPPKRDHAPRAVPWPSSRAGGRSGASHPSSLPPDADVRVAGRRRDR